MTLQQGNDSGQGTYNNAATNQSPFGRPASTTQNDSNHAVIRNGVLAGSRVRFGPLASTTQSDSNRAVIRNGVEFGSRVRFGPKVGFGFRTNVANPRRYQFNRFLPYPTRPDPTRYDPTRSDPILHSYHEISHCYPAIIAVPTINEVGTYENALKQNAQYCTFLESRMQTIQKELVLAKAREVKLQRAKSEGLFKCPFELSRHEENLAFQAEIAKRKERIEQEKKAEIKKLRTNIAHNWRYAIRCNIYVRQYGMTHANNSDNNNNDNYNANNYIPTNDYNEMISLMKNEISSLIKNEMISLMKNEDELKTYNNKMGADVMAAHKLHNEKLLKTHVERCPLHCNDECFTTVNCHTTICRTKIYWETSHVDWLNDLTLSDTRPVGYYVAC